MSARIHLPSFDRMRVMLSIAAGLLSGFRAFQWVVGQAKPRDFDQTWYAARALLAGRNPYAEIGPGLSFEWAQYFYYPLNAPIAVAPLALLPRSVASILFAAVTSGAFVWAATRRSLAPAVVITSASAAFAAETVQWSPLLGASFGVPWLSIFLSAKPTIGIAFFLARPTRWAVIGAVSLTAIGLFVLPSWPHDWIAAVQHTSLVMPGGTTFLAPIVTPGGALAVLMLLRWRRPEARLVLALASVPQTPLLYETVPLFLVPQTIIEGGVLWLGSWLVGLTQWLGSPFPTELARYMASEHAIGWLMYLPCVVIVLRRPNTGPIPAWLESQLRVWRVPTWIMGRAA
jgi:hypothetical protein